MKPLALVANVLILAAAAAPLIGALSPSASTATASRPQADASALGDKSNVTHADSYSDGSSSGRARHARRREAKARPRSEAAEEGAAQVRRVARNVRRKLDLLSGRMDQIQSIIAQDHQDNNATLDSASSPAPDESPNELSAANGEPAEAPTNQNESWSLGEGNGDDQDLGRLSGAAPSRPVANESQKWSSPVIRSVIPGKSVDRPSSGENGRNGNGRPSISAPAEADSLQDNSLQQDRFGDESSSSTLRPMVESGGDSPAANGQEATTPPASSMQEQTQALPSLMGPEWVPNQNYQFFSELNAKNHGGRTGQQSAYGPQNNRGGKFQNMTILNSETDLANSYSIQQPQQPTAPPSTGAEPSASDIQQSGEPAGAGPIASTRKPGDDRQANNNGNKRSSSVYTYSASNYGKSSRDQSRSTTSQPYLVASADWPQSQNGTTTGTGANRFQQAQQSADDEQQQAMQPIRWPSLATASYPTAPPSESAEIGLPATSNNSPQPSRYSSIMMPAGSGGQSANGHSHGSSRVNRVDQMQLNFNEPHVGQQNQPDLSMDPAPGGDLIEPLGAHKYSLALPSADSGAGTLAGTTERRRSTETQRQSSPEPVSVYQPVDSSSSRIDDPRANGTGDLKHRSAAGSSGDERVGLSYAQADAPGVSSTMDQQLQHIGADASTGGFYPTQAADSIGAEHAVPFRPSQVLGSAADQRSFLGGGQTNEQAGGSPVADSSFAYGGYPTGARPTDQSGEPTNGGAVRAPLEPGLSAEFGGANSDASQMYQLSPRLSFGAQYQGYANNQEALQPAATNINNLIRQRQLQQQQQQPAGVDLATLLYLQRYQQQQRALLAHLQQQQRLQQALTDQSQLAPAPARAASSLGAPSLARAFYSGDQTHQQQDTGLAAAIQNNMRKRYSPETTLASYLTSRSASDATGSPASPAGGQYLFSQASSQSPALLYSPATVRAYQRLLAAAAQQQQLAASTSVSYLAAGSHQQATPNGTGGAPANGLYATAAIHQPVFYEAPASNQQRSSSLADATTSSADSSTTIAATGQNRPLVSAYGSLANRRNYFSGLFKPSASSRYYYSPTILSPIGLASPTSLHSIYAPSAAYTPSAHDMSMASGTSPLTQFYTTAAASPYAAYAHAPSAAALDPQQYQHALAAAAAAANGLQSHYMSSADADMAESSLVPSDSSSTSYSASAGDAGAGPSSFNSALNDSNDSGGSSALSGSKGSKGMTQWASIAGLLLGVLPFGMLMAHMLPALTVAGRRKRELEFGARNFSDFLNWQPSRMLSALINAPDESSVLTNGTHVLNSLTASLDRPGEPAGGPKSRVRHQESRPLWAADSKSARRDSGVRQLARWRQKVSAPSSLHKPEPIQQQPTAYDLATNSSSTKTQANLPTPPPSLSTSTHHKVAPADSSNQNQRVKSKVKRVFDAVNNFIVTAQKRKHRSSLIETQWNIPSVFKNLFSLGDIKSQLAGLVHSRLISNQYSVLPAVANSWLQPLTRENSAAESNPNETSASQTMTNNHRATVTVLPTTSGEQNATKKQQMHHQVDHARQQPQSDSQTAPPVAGVHPAAQADMIVGSASDDSLLSAQINVEPTKNTSLIVVATSKQIDKQPEVRQQITISPPLNELGGESKRHFDNSTRTNIVNCLNKFFCDLVVGINQSFRLNAHTNKNNGLSILRAKNSNTTPPTSEQLEKATKEYINQLIEQFQANEKYSSISLASFKGNDSNRNSLDALYKIAMRNECSLMYSCLETPQSQKTLLRILKRKG